MLFSSSRTCIFRFKCSFSTSSASIRAGQSAIALTLASSSLTYLSFLCRKARCAALFCSALLDSITVFFVEGEGERERIALSLGTSFFSVCVSGCSCCCCSVCDGGGLDITKKDGRGGKKRDGERFFLYAGSHESNCTYLRNTYFWHEKWVALHKQPYHGYQTVLSLGNDKALLWLFKLNLGNFQLQQLHF
ncbi:uncharacterized protein B0P05DRAFT_529703 [Gilbertella persicaria]|uniref:uncharacterized protein n=1 Tax=Gilbertella persicaria TaxID=101096 RepID=UPI0022207243|nr:uncharacterized protein B0P05DRAFT_529703 [Gilbertella persicaria]KAI8090187.1 hypothetical protein B0P05DRAFT_529703 [Gilbertella persicaria]